MQNVTIILLTIMLQRKQIRDNHIQLLNWRKTRKKINVKTPKRRLYNNNGNGGHGTQQKTN